MEENKIKQRHENPEGLHARYQVKKLIPYVDFWGIERVAAVDPSEGAEYFVLRLDNGGSDSNHIRAGRIAIAAYAREIERYLPKLAKDLRDRYPVVVVGPDYVGEELDILKSEVSVSVRSIAEALKQDKGYFGTWQANVATAFQDEFEKEYGEKQAEIWNIPEISNRAATAFLNALIDIAK